MISKAHGFTLTELMIVVVVVAILAAIAFPSYQSFVRKARRAEAISELLDLQLNQEKWRTHNPAYASAISDLGSPDQTYYTFSLVSATNTYTLTADPKVGTDQVNDKQSGTACDPLTIDQDRSKTPADCW